MQALSETSSSYLVMSIVASKMLFWVISIAQALTILSIGFFSITDKRLLNHGGVQLRCFFFGECFVEKGDSSRNIVRNSIRKTSTKNSW